MHTRLTSESYSASIQVGNFWDRQDRNIFLWEESMGQKEEKIWEKRGFGSISVIEIAFAERKKVIDMHSMQCQDR